MDEVKDALKSFICDEVIYLNDEEIALIEENEKEYLQDKWIRGNNPPHSITKAKRFSTGLVSINVEVVKNKIKNISFSGDFMWLNDVNELASHFIGLDFEKEIIELELNEINVEDYMMGISNSELVSLLFE